MTEKIVYEISPDDLVKVMTEIQSKIDQEQRFSHFKNTFVEVSTVCYIHKVHRDTVYNYIREGRLKPIDRVPGSKILFRLSDVLAADLMKGKKVATIKQMMANGKKY